MLLLYPGELYRLLGASSLFFKHKVISDTMPCGGFHLGYMIHMKYYDIVRDHPIIIHVHFGVNKKYYYIRLYFTVFLLARSNTRDIPFSNILISKKQFLCNKKAYCTLVQNQ
jgi:hypothetical protein